MIKINIDVTKITKEKLFKGKKGTYLNAVLIETKDNQYGNDYVIVEDITEEEKNQGKKGQILGNAKIMIPKTNNSSNTESDDLPF